MWITQSCWLMDSISHTQAYRLGDKIRALWQELLEMMNIEVGSESRLLAITHSLLGALEWRMGLYLYLISTWILFPGSYLESQKHPLSRI